jgi:precorrin-6Y C5,15-methyltransferase (decarboxylating)
MVEPIHVVGVGNDGPAGLPERTRAIIDRAAVLVGGGRNLRHWAAHPARKIVLGDLEAGVAALRDAYPTAPTVVLASGDPLFFGIGRFLLERLPADDLVFHPHPGSVASAFAAIKMPWDDAEVISLHGRPIEALDAALCRRPDKLAVLTDGRNTPAVVAERVRAGGGYEMWVCEDLDGPDARVQRFTPDSLNGRSFSPLNVVVLRRTTGAPADVAAPAVPGLPDSAFARRAGQPGMITKAEVRVLTLARLELRDGMTIWDVGAGAGSVGIEAARLCPAGRVCLVERRAEDADNIRANVAKFGLRNAVVVAGEAPAALAGLPTPDRVFVGGSGGRLAEILAVVRERLAPAGVCAVNACTEPTRTGAIAAFTACDPPWRVDVLDVNLTASEPGVDPPRTTAFTPVGIIRARKP